MMGKEMSMNASFTVEICQRNEINATFFSLLKGHITLNGKSVCGQRGSKDSLQMSTPGVLYLQGYLIVYACCKST